MIQPFNSKKYLLCFSLATIALIVTGAVLSAIWFYHYGVGEYAHSPNGRYTAHLTLIKQRTLSDGEIEYVQAKVVDTQQDQTIWRLEYRPINTSHFLNYGNRQHSYIQWAPSSDKVTFPMNTKGYQITVAIP